MQALQVHRLSFQSKGWARQEGQQQPRPGVPERQVLEQLPHQCHRRAPDQTYVKKESSIIKAFADLQTGQLSGPLDLQLASYSKGLEMRLLVNLFYSKERQK